MPTQPFSNRTSQLSATKRALLEKRLRGESVSPPKMLTIPKRSPETTLQLSFAQERLWFFNFIELRATQLRTYDGVVAILLGHPL